MKGRKHEGPFSIDLPFDDALRRFLATKPAEVAESIEQEKREKERKANLGASSDGEKKAPKAEP